MSHAVRRDQWAQTSELIAALYNTVRDAKKRKQPYRGSDFNPFVAAQERPTGIEAFGRLLGMTDYQARRAAGG